MMRAARWVWALLRDARGGVAVEASLLFPVLLVLLSGAVEYGDAYHTRMVLNSALQAGIQTAVLTGGDAVAVRAAVIGELNGALDEPVVTVSGACTCPNGTAVSCSASCGTAGTARMHVTIEVSGERLGPFTSTGFTLPETIRATAVARVR